MWRSPRFSGSFGGQRRALLTVREPRAAALGQAAPHTGRVGEAGSAVLGAAWHAGCWFVLRAAWARCGFTAVVARSGTALQGQTEFRGRASQLLVPAAHSVRPGAAEPAQQLQQREVDTTWHDRGEGVSAASGLSGGPPRPRRRRGDRPRPRLRYRPYWVPVREPAPHERPRLDARTACPPLPPCNWVRSGGAEAAAVAKALCCGQMSALVQFYNRVYSW